MRDGLDRLVRLFVAPPEAGAAPVAPGALATPAVGLLCSARDAHSLAAATALLLAARLGLPAAVALVWTGEDPDAARLMRTARAARRFSSVPAARRVADRMQRRGIDCAPAGRLVTVPLPTAAAAAVDAARRTLAAANVPCALALAGPRCAESDGLMAQVDATAYVFPPGAGPVAELVADSLPVHGIACELGRVGPLARALAAYGLGAAPPLRAALAPLVGAVT